MMAQLTSLNLGDNFIGVAGAGWQEEARESGEYLRRRFVPQCRVVVNGTTLGTGPAMHGELVASESDFGLLKPQAAPSGSLACQWRDLSSSRADLTWLPAVCRAGSDGFKLAGLQVDLAPEPWALCAVGWVADLAI